MKADRYEEIQRSRDFVAITLRSHVQKVVTAKYRSLVLEGVLPVNQSVDETTKVVRELTRSYVEDVLPDDVNSGNISMFL